MATKSKKPAAGAKPPRKKPVPIAPEKRGRRGHRAVDQQPGLREWLVERLQQTPRPTVDELVEELKATGYSIGRTAVWEFGTRFEIERAKKELYVDLAFKYNSGDQGNVLDIETAVASFGAQMIWSDLLDKAGEGVTPELLTTLDAFRKLQSSSSSRERARFAVDRGVKAATVRIRAGLQELLRADPDLLQRVLAAVDQASREARVA